MMRCFLLALFSVVLSGVESRASNLPAAFAAPSRTPARTSSWVAPIVSSAAFLLTTTAALAGDANLLNGAALFQANCAGCHAGGMNLMSEKKTLKKEALEQYQSLDQAQIQKFVQQGMPHKLLPFSRTLTDADYFDATSFVLDQALNDKW